MQLTQEIKNSIEESTLCWLASSDAHNQPNVSPKEVFCHYNNTILIANIASPQSKKNIEVNNKVALSFIQIFKERGFQLKGKATVINEQDIKFEVLKNRLEKITKDRYPFKSIFSIEVLSSKPIIAPCYILYPEISEEEHIKISRQNYLK